MTETIVKSLNGVKFTIVLTDDTNETKVDVQAVDEQNAAPILGVGGGRPKCR